MDSSIEMIGVLHPREGKVARVKQLFSELAQEVVKHEAGCQLYNVYVQTKSKDIPNVTLHEKYVDQNALDAHLRSNHFLVAASALDQEDLLRIPLELDDVFVECIAGHHHGWSKTTNGQEQDA